MTLHRALYTINFQIGSLKSPTLNLENQMAEDLFRASNDCNHQMTLTPSHYPSFFLSMGSISFTFYHNNMYFFPLWHCKIQSSMHPPYPTLALQKARSKNFQLELIGELFLSILDRFHLTFIGFCINSGFLPIGSN